MAEKEKKELTKIDGKVVAKKKPLWKRFVDMFEPDDTENIKDYVIDEVLLPGIYDNVSNLAIDAVNAFLSMIFHKKPNYRRNSYGSSKVSYSSYYDSKKDRDREDRYRKVLDPIDVIFEQRSDAELALDSLKECISKYEVATINDFYDIARVTGSGEYTDEYYGWRDVSGAYIGRVREGYVINLPRAYDIR